ncbi:MAG: MFS transporter, partial [Pseudomonadota bacterium]|nr:MFS transporter [Pseudomonadota bacterium]
MDLSKNKKIKRTNWFQVYLLIGAGVVCAFQIGKVPPALPVIRNDLGLDLIFTGWLIGVYALFAAVFGIFGGVFSDAAGYRRSLLFGLSCITIGSFSGAIAPDGLSLLIARFIEAVGYL